MIHGVEYQHTPALPDAIVEHNPLEQDSGSAALALLVERRRATRHPIAVLPLSLEAMRCRILPGEEVSVVNVSANGLRIETTRALGPGRSITLQLGSVRSPPHAVNAFVIHCAVAALGAGGSVLFAVGLQVESLPFEGIFSQMVKGGLRLKSREDAAIRRVARERGTWRLA